jgi:hypothetical protein
MASLNAEQRELVASLIKKHDFRFWFDGLTVAEAKDRIERAAAFPLSKAAFIEIRNAVCDWFGVYAKPKPSELTELTGGEWIALRRAVWDSREELKRRSLAEAVAIVSLKFRCNEKLLEGLGSDVHFWGWNYSAEPAEKANAEGVRP